MKTKQHTYGWNPDVPDHRDKLLSFAHFDISKLPEAVDLRPGCPPVYDQGQLGSCTANAIGALHQYQQKAQKLTDFPPARLFIYYNERAIEGSISTDSGAQIRDGMKTIGAKGVCPEPLWPYNIVRFRTKPSPACYTDGMKHQAITYSRLLPTAELLQGCLAKGQPFVFGFTVYESFASAAVAKNGIVPMPSTFERSLGGHAVMAVGYKKLFGKVYLIVRNSWGVYWGDKGYFYMPIEYATNSNLADDFWTLSLIEG